MTNTILVINIPYPNFDTVNMIIVGAKDPGVINEEGDSFDHGFCS